MWSSAHRKHSSTPSANCWRDAASVVHGGDPDREGQLLVDEVLEHFRYRGPVFRIWLPSLDDRSVSIALGNITDNAANAPLRDAAAPE